MKNFIENKCYEVVRQCKYYDYCKEDLLKAVGYIDVNTADSLVRKAVKFRDAKERCEQTFTLVRQFVWATENEEYMQMWDDIVEGYLEKKWA